MRPIVLAAGSIRHLCIEGLPFAASAGRCGSIATTTGVDHVRVVGMTECATPERVEEKTWEFVRGLDDSQDVRVAAGPDLGDDVMRRVINAWAAMKQAKDAEAQAALQIRQAVNELRERGLSRTSHSWRASPGVACPSSCCKASARSCLPQAPPGGSLPAGVLPSALAGTVRRRPGPSLGRPTEVLLRALTPQSFGLAKPTRLVQIGESARPAPSLRAVGLRTSGVEIYGAAKGFAPTGAPRPTSRSSTGPAPPCAASDWSWCPDPRTTQTGGPAPPPRGAGSKDPASE